ncbi:hypothetical protein niasHT_028943 [Heterodera trifolii]|uniref:HMG box domain-containing protein n=1 Tax=Heterodera trifolii TaxID=157864 RepID=A0ABD2K0V0_9BILA
MYRPSSSHRSAQQEAMRPPPKLPDRPLVPYMRFSKKTWPKVRAEKPDVPLWELGKIIGHLWNNISPAEKAMYNHEYEQDKIEYEKAMKQYNAAYSQYMASKSRVKSAHQQHQQDKGGSGRKTTAAGASADAAGIISGVFMQPIEDEDPFELAGKRLAAIRYDRNNRLMAELFSPSYLPDPRVFVPQQRIDHFRRQRMSLEQHQVKSNEELARMAELFSQRKRAIQRDSEAYNEMLKKVCAERPRVDQQRCEELTEQYKEQLLNAWDQFQTKQAAIQAKLEADRRANPVLSELITGKSPTQEEEEQQQQQQNGMEENSDEPMPNNEENEEEEKQQLLEEERGGEGEREEQKEMPKMEEEKEVSREREERDEEERVGEEEGKEEGGSVKEKDANDGGDEKKEEGEEEITEEKNGGGDEKEQNDGTAAAEGIGGRNEDEQNQ